MTPPPPNTMMETHPQNNNKHKKCNSHTDNHSQIQVAKTTHSQTNILIKAFLHACGHRMPTSAHPKFSCGSILSRVIIIIITSPYTKGPTRAQATHSSHIYIYYYSTIGSPRMAPDSKDQRVEQL